ncbi:MAG: polysaccharide biosynthesis/export family protein [Bacteroidales bacterium]|nr:polysaccharide biosynthesis/export family protein [Bacteroidales bacterium]
MKNKNTIFRLLALILLISLTDSCVSYRKTGFLQDMTESSQIELENKVEAVIAPGDELRIIVSSYDEAIAKPFNVLNSQFAGTAGSQNQGYMVNANGDITLPVLGNVRAAGLTRLQLTEKLVSLLKDNGYISDPFVDVRFINFKIFVLGTDKCQALTIKDDKCTFLEALALSGGINQYTRRDRMAVMREVNGKMTLRYLDPRSSKIFNDPYYVLQQNDFIITQDIGAKYLLNETNLWMSWITMGTSIASTIAMFVVANNNSKK